MLRAKLIKMSSIAVIVRDFLLKFAYLMVNFLRMFASLRIEINECGRHKKGHSRTVGGKRKH